jgi:phosphoenolpyruvate phosphomutase
MVQVRGSSRQTATEPPGECNCDASRFRQLLASKRLTNIAGVHDAVSGIVAEQAGFPALWASGYGISAAAGVPDLNILTMTEMVSFVARIKAAVTIPVLVDCDSGYGDERIVERTGREYSRAGISALCIEDKQFPKRSSLYDGPQDLETITVAVRKICALRTGAGDHALIVARTEALVSGAGLEDALQRSHSYADGGADAILVQSTANTAEEVLAFAESWQSRLPLIVVPTTYRARPDELTEAGVDAAIFANQLLRAAIHAIQVAAEALWDGRGAETIPLASLRGVAALVGCDDDKVPCPVADCEHRSSWHAGQNGVAPWA